MAERRTGSVKFFNTEKGYGFIAPDDGGKDVFIHASALTDSGIAGLTEKDRVSFAIASSPKGDKAVDLEKD